MSSSIISEPPKEIFEDGGQDEPTLIHEGGMWMTLIDLVFQQLTKHYSLAQNQNGNQKLKME